MGRQRQKTPKDRPHSERLWQRGMNKEQRERANALRIAAAEARRERRRARNRSIGL